MAEFVTVASFLDSTEAHVVPGLLEADGIGAHLGAALHATANWPLSNALGGVQLRVATDDDARARDLISAYHAGERSWVSLLLMIPALFLAAPYPPRRTGYRCRGCRERAQDVL